MHAALLHAARPALRSMGFDRAGAEALLIAKTDAVRQGAPAMIAAFGDLYDSLRPEQQQELRDLMEKGRHGHEGRHSRDHDRR